MNVQLNSSWGGSGSSRALLAVGLLLSGVAHSLNQVQADSKDQEDGYHLEALLTLGEDCRQHSNRSNRVKTANSTATGQTVLAAKSDRDLCY